MTKKEPIKIALAKIFSGIEKLRANFPVKEFTFDGRLVGDIGEVIVQRDYDVDLYKKLVKKHDGVTSNGRKVQIKATFKNSLTFSKIPDYYLGIKLYEDGTYDEIYNGSSNQIKKQFGHRKGFGKDLLSFSNKKLIELSDKIPARNKIPKRKTII